MSVNIKNDRLQKLRKAHVPTTLLLDEREPRKLDSITLPASVQEKVHRIQRKLATWDELHTSKPVISEKDKETTSVGMVNMIDLVQSYQVHLYETSMKVRNSLHGKLDDFAEEMSNDEREEYEQRLEDRIISIAKSIDEKYKKKKEELDRQVYIILYIVCI